MSEKNRFIQQFEKNKANILFFLGQTKDIAIQLEEIGINSERLRKRIENAKSELLKGEFRIGVIGRFRIGKSTFLNVFLGNRVLKEREAGGGCTAVVTKVKSGRDTGAKVYYNTPEEMYDLFITAFREAAILPELYSVVVDEVPEKERLHRDDFRENNRAILIAEKENIKEGFNKKKALIEFALYIVDHWQQFKGELGTVEEVSHKRYLDISTDRTRAPFIKEIQLTVDFTGILPENVVLMDTPGLGAANWDENITIKHLKECHAAIHMLLPPAGFESIDLNLLTNLKEQQPHIFDKMLFVVNRSDEISIGAKQEIKTYIEDEIARIGFSHAPILFCCSKLPFLIEVKEKKGELSPDELEYIDFTSYRFRLDKKSGFKKEIMDVCGFAELQKAVTKLLESNRAGSILQQSTENIGHICGEIEGIFSSHKAMVESGGSGESKLLEQIDELIAMIDYEKDRVDREIFQATASLRSKIFSWLRPYESIMPHNDSFFKSFLDSFKNPALYEGRKKKTTTPNDVNVVFLGFPMKVSGFKEKIDAVSAEVAEYIEEFWSWEHYNIRSEEIVNSEEDAKKLSGETLTEKVMDIMRTEFITELSAKTEDLLTTVLDEARDDMSNLYKAALEKTRGEITGISHNVISKLNKILKTSFKPLEIGQFTTNSIESLTKTKTHLANLGREHSVWEKTITMTHTIFVNSYKDKIVKKERMRLGRIRRDMVEHLENNLFIPVTRNIVSYIKRVVKELREVMMVEVEMQLEDIKAYALVDRFGNSQEQIKANIEKAAAIKEDVEKVESLYHEQLLATKKNIQI